MMTPVELWERSGALATLGELLRRSTDGGRVALVAGEAGIGKSSLVRAFAAGSRVDVFWGLCDPLLTPRASGPLHDIARQVGGRMAVSPGAPELLDELASRHGRRVVVIEDVHWADGATLDAIVFLGRRIDRLPVLLVVTYRDDEIGPEHPLRSALAALPRHVVASVAVAPLSETCVAGQARLAGRDPSTVYGLTGGNPLLVTELLSDGDGGVPASVRDLVLARIGRLSTAARDVARLVSVMPGRASGVPLDADAVEECLAAGVLVPDGDTVAYRHELLRHAVEDSLSPTRRAALHRHVLHLLAAQAATDPARTDPARTDPARLVHHATHAGDTAALLRYGLVAAARAADLGAHREAAAHYRAVRPHAGGLPAPELASMLERYAVQAYLSGDAPAGLDALHEALALRRRSGDAHATGENLRWVSRLAWWSGRGDEAMRAAVEAVEVLETVDGRELAMAYSNRSQLHMLAHELPEAVEWGERARVLADRLGDPETSLHAAINVASARRQAGDVTATEALRRLHDQAAAAGLVDHAARALVNRATTLVEASRYAEAAAALTDALAYAEAHDLDGYARYLYGVRATIRLEACEWDAALADADASLGPSGGPTGRTGVSGMPALVAKGRILTARGDGTARAVLDRAAELAYGTGEIQRIGPVASARAEYFLLAGEPARAADEADRGLALAAARGHHGYTAELAYRRWRATGEPVDGSTPYHLMMRGDHLDAAAAWTACGRRYSRTLALAAGDLDAAAEALAVLDDLGAVAVARRVRAELRRRGFKGVPRGPRPKTTANVAGLTARQLEVLGLLAEGLSNAEIAARLTVSHKTVEHHISAVLDKLSVTTRSQAVAAAHRLRLVVAR